MKVVALKRAGLIEEFDVWQLTSKSVESTSLSLQSVDNIHSGDCLSLGVLSVGNSITDDILQKDLENTTSLLVDETRDSLHTTTASKTTDGWLGDSLDVITKDLPVALCASLSETFASFATSRHDRLSFVTLKS